ncbi:MAG: amino acid adenylation domain-containing protein, partial [Cyanobacteria bacterium J06559_3]
PLRSLFEQPTLAQLAMVVDSLKQGEPVGVLEAIAPVERSSPLLLSDAQQRQWVLAQLEPESPFYIMPTAVRVQGDLSLDWLQQSLERVVERHEVLRTAFQDVEGKAQLEIYPQVDVSMPLMDFSGLDEAAQRQCVQEQIHQEAQTPLDLSCAPLLRMRVLRLAAADHVILLSLHHIITDGWSMGILVRELAQIYEALQAKRSVELPPLPIQYVDYAAWQQQQAKQQPLTYWQQQLQGVSPLLELPTDYPRPAVQSFEGATYEFRLSADQTRALQELSQQQGVTLFMTLLAAFQVLLYRYSGIEDLVIGTPIANRQRQELEGLIGLFVNTLVLRTDLSGNPRFEELLRRVRAMALDAYAHQSVPFEQVVDALEVPRSWSHSPLFQVMFVLQNAPMDAIALDGLIWRPLSTDSNTAKFDLTLSMRLDEHELQGTLEYRTDLFKAETIYRMAGHLLQLLTVVAQQPTSRIAELPMLTEFEQAQLWQWNQTQTDYPRDRCIHQIFEQQAEKTPDAIALIYGDQHFTYQALNAQANQLARHLRTTYAVLPDTLIGLWAERSPKTIVAMLAILKAGGAYVPLDPTYPQARLQFMIADAQLSLVITPKAIELPAEASACQQLVLTTEALAIAQQNADDSPTLTSPDNLAYVLYTSGSTGQPKGVCTPHRGVVRLLQGTDYAHFGPDEVFLQAASLSFDASTFEIWGALLNGGKLVLLPIPSPSLADLAGAIAQHQVTTLWLNAGLFHLMVDEQLEALKPIRQLLAGGDVLSSPHIRKALAALPYTRLINGYGPTENTTFTCCHPMTADSLEDSLTDTSPPIGHPIANTQIYVLDANLQPAPIGIPGELYISGDGLARGYLNRPELTAERFVPNPFAQGIGNREQGTGHRGNGELVIGNGTTRLPTTHYPLPTTLYKTGDRVRLTPNGTVAFLGRLDNQVKIRGFRIELGEIETALLSHPAVEQTIVVPWTGYVGQRRLVAYVVSESGVRNQEPGVRSQEANSEFRISNSEFDNTTPQILRQYLAEKLPDYMLPTAFIFLDVLPLTSNGKVDRQALPAPVWESATTETVPQTAVEQTLADIWAAVLRLGSVGVRDNFFELGGDSILALQMVSRAAQAGVSLSPRQIFQHQTIAELAALAGTTATSVEADLVVGSVPLTPIQHWFFEQKLAHPHHFNQAACLELPLTVDRDRLDQAIQKVMAYHDALRLRFSKTDEGWQQWFAEPELSVVDSVAWVDLTALSKAEQTEAIAAHADQLQASLNLASGPLVRVGGFELGTERPSQLLIVIHHLVVDGLSWRILLEDLLLAYQQADGGFLPKTASFKQWSLWLQSVTSQCEDKDTLRYWQTMPQNFVIPVDYNTRENIAAATQTVTIELSSQYTQALLQDVPSTYNTQINDVLLTALLQVFAKWTGERSLLLTLENYGRRPEVLGGELNLARTVGWFTCLHPVYLQLIGSDPGEHLKAIKGQLRQLPHEGLSYGLLRYGAEVEGLAVEPPISFNYLGQFDTLLAEAEGFRLLPTPRASNSPGNRRSHLLDINGWIRHGQLQIEWTYSQNYHDRTTVEGLAQNYLAALQQLIDHCQDARQQGYTPDDFNLVQLDQATLDAVLGKVTFQGGAGQ